MSTERFQFFLRNVHLDFHSFHFITLCPSMS
jgi:hypothetical protein